MEKTAAPATSTSTSTSTTAVIKRRLDLILSQVLLKLDLVIQRDLTKLNKQITTKPKQATTTTTTLANQQQQNPRQITPPFLASICLEQPPAKRRIEEEEHLENKSSDTHSAQRRKKSESLDDDLIIILEHSSSNSNSNEPSSSQHTHHYPLQSLPSFTNKTTTFRIPQPPTTSFTPPTLTISSTQSPSIQPILPKLSPPVEASDHLPSQQASQVAGESDLSTRPALPSRRRAKKKRRTRMTGSGVRGGELANENQKGQQGDDPEWAAADGEDSQTYVRYDEQAGGPEQGTIYASQDQPSYSEESWGPFELREEQQPDRAGMMIGNLMRWGHTLAPPPHVPRFARPTPSWYNNYHHQQQQQGSLEPGELVENNLLRTCSPFSRPEFPMTQPVPPAYNPLPYLTHHPHPPSAYYPNPYPPFHPPPDQSPAPHFTHYPPPPPPPPVMSDFSHGPSFDHHSF
ncbi:hypothetical protein PGT21_015572 [Puccinia graminis f. sp. tritici]|uniref:Uncharacterized protein n=1 Tax=Puccinia graminis f. sp. tritici TaxID=56615 RepID=A0A5B0PKY6_PUCGR|nr:hypothetical protein PGT21_015572 [Puccinia graminis f. sp. tritici]